MEYYSLLGVAPGSTAEQVKNAFRSRIKACHPDRVPGDGERARKLIEAYKGIQKGQAGPPREEAPVRAERPQQQRPPGFNVRYHEQATTYRAGREAGRRIFESVFDKVDLAGSVENFWDALHRSVLEEGEETEVYGKDVPIREVHWQNRPEGITNGKAREVYERAEIVLREVVQKFDAQKKRARRQWARDYVSNLTQVQVLFRDGMNRHPSLTGRCLNRLQQIHELIREIKKMGL
ncbi:MAG: DnaJ domain-containing protein [Spirochaetia bacterium]|nr:DnaJ domain-containing protein [Spirochaetia bacterium]